MSTLSIYSKQNTRLGLGLRVRREMLVMNEFYPHDPLDGVKSSTNQRGKFIPDEVV